MYIHIDFQPQNLKSALAKLNEKAFDIFMQIKAQSQMF